MQELRVCKFFQSGRERVGSYENGRIFDLNLCAARHLSTKNGDADAAGLANTSVPPYLEDFIKGGDATIEAARESLAWVLESGNEEGSNGEPLSRGLEEIKLEAPVLGDSKIICLGDTYESHMAVKGDPLPDHFGLFYKMTQVVVGPDDFVVIPKHHDDPVVYGTELTLVIGKEGRSIREEEAEDHVWGYTILNDVTLRNMAFHWGPTPKVFETSAPIGPWIVPKDQIKQPNDLKLLFRLNGKPVQDGTTGDMRFPLFPMISEISWWHKLRPGDIIATGDIGATESAKPGDVMEAEIPEIGVLRNPVKSED